MEQTTNDSEAVTANDLRAAGASDLFVSYFNQTNPRFSAHREVVSGPFSLERLNESPSLGGGFFEALWNGDAESAWGRADGRNRPVIERVAPHAKPEWA